MVKKNSLQVVAQPTERNMASLDECTDTKDTTFKTIDSFIECTSAKVTGVISSVSEMSPSKKGGDYFHATLNDGEKEARLVGFRKRQRDLLQEFEASGETVDIAACTIKKSKKQYGDDFNVMLGSKTTFVTSPTKVEIDKEKLARRSNPQLHHLPNITDGSRISCKVKVLRIEEKQLVSNGQALQNVIISDSSMASKMVLWNDDINKFEVGNSYHLKHILVKSYQGEKYLQFPKQGASFEQLEDIGTVATDDVNTYEQITNSEIAGVISFDDFLLCLICTNKVQPSDDQFGSCTECNTVQKINLCKRQMRAKLLLTRPGGNYITLSVFGDHLKHICCEQPVTRDNLLHAPPFTFTYNNQVINSISR